MASAEDLFECQICMENMIENRPRLLSCHHSFCQPCLEKIKEGCMIVCPTCRNKTDLKGGEVQELSVNFHVLKMWEILEKQKQPKEPTSLPNCNVCSQDVAETKCEKCNKVFCQSCEIKHDKVKIYKDHQIFQLCSKHMDSITHICHRCQEPVCTTCMLNEHSEHSEDCSDFDKGMQAIRSDLESKLPIIQDARRKMQQVKNVAEKNEKEINQVLLNLTERLRFHEEKAQRTANLMAKIKQNTLAETKAIQADCVNAEQDFKEAEEYVSTSMLIKRSKILSCVKDAEQRTEIVLKRLDTLLVMVKNPFPYTAELQDVSELPFWVKEPIQYRPVPEIAILQNLSSHDRKAMQQPEIELENLVQVGSYDVGSAVDIVKFGEKSVLVATKRSVLLYDIYGTRLHEFFPKDQTKDILGVDCLAKELYILQRDMITKITVSGMIIREYAFTAPPNFSPRSICVIDSDHIIILTETAVYMSLPKTGAFDTLISNMRYLCQIRLTTTTSGKKYMICAESDNAAYGTSRVLFFDDGWNTAGHTGPYGSREGELRGPRGLATTPSGDIIVADTWNNRISLFSSEGGFKRQVLTEKRGIKAPSRVSYSSPYLWIIEHNLNLLKCFKES